VPNPCELLLKTKHAARSKLSERLFSKVPWWKRLRNVRQLQYTSQTNLGDSYAVIGRIRTFLQPVLTRSSFQQVCNLRNKLPQWLPREIMHVTQFYREKTFATNTFVKCSSVSCMQCFGTIAVIDKLVPAIAVEIAVPAIPRIALDGASRYIALGVMINRKLSSCSMYCRPSSDVVCVQRRWARRTLKNMVCQIAFFVRTVFKAYPRWVILIQLCRASWLGGISPAPMIETELGH